MNKINLRKQFFSFGRMELSRAIVSNKMGLLLCLFIWGTNLLSAQPQSEPQIIVEPKYESYLIKNNLIWVKQNEKWGIISESGEVKTPCQYDTMVFLRFNRKDSPRGTISVKKEGKWGMIDVNKGSLTETLPCKYDKIKEAADLFELQNLDKWGFADKTGELIPCKYDSIKKDYGFYYYRVYIQGKVGVVRYGSEDVACQYDSVLLDWKDAKVKKSGKWGVVVYPNKEIIPCEYDIILHAGRFFFKIKQNEKWGLFNFEGIQMTPFKYDDIEDMLPVEIGCYMGKAKRDNKWVLINAEGKELTPSGYDTISYFSDNYVYVNNKSKWGVANYSGKQIVPCKYEEIEYFSDNLLAVKLKGKWGFADTTGKEKIACKYESVGSFRDGLSAVKKNGKFGVIDKTGKQVIPFKYEEITIYGKEYIEVTETGKPTQAINYKQELVETNYADVMAPSIDEMENSSGGWTPYEYKITLSGYDEVIKYHIHYALFKKNGKWGILRLN